MEKSRIEVSSDHNSAPSLDGNVYRLVPDKMAEIRFSDPREDPPKIFEVHFRKLLPRSIEKCRGCCVKITPNDLGMLVRTYGIARWTKENW